MQGNGLPRLRSKLLLLLPCLLALTLVLSSCRFLAHTTVNPDGSGQFLEAQVFEYQHGEDLKAACDRETYWPSTPADATYREEVHDGYLYCYRTRSFSDLQELHRSYYAWDGLDGTHVSVDTLQLENGHFTYDVYLDLTGRTETEGYYEVHLTVPGTLGTHNADQVKGQMLIWGLYPGQKARLYAESNVSASESNAPVSAPYGLLDNSPWLAIAGVALIVSVICLAAIVFLKRRNRKATKRTAKRLEEIDRIARQAQQVNKQMSENFAVAYRQAVSDLNWINHVEQSYSNLTREDKAALRRQKERILKTLRNNTATANEELLRRFYADN